MQIWIDITAKMFFFANLIRRKSLNFVYARIVEVRLELLH